jgi:hypothetical protein
VELRCRYCDTAHAPIASGFPDPRSRADGLPLPQPDEAAVYLPLGAAD